MSMMTVPFESVCGADCESVSRGGRPSFARSLLVSSTEREISSPDCDGFSSFLSISSGGKFRLARNLFVSSIDKEISPFDSAVRIFELIDLPFLFGERERLGEREL